MVFFNDLAFYAVLISAVGGALCYGFTRHRELSIVVGLLCGAVFDLYKRWHHDDEPYPYLHPNAGAHVTFLPFWLCVILLGVYAGLSELGWV
jgi:hypothetical protein